LAHSKKIAIKGPGLQSEFSVGQMQGDAGLAKSGGAGKCQTAYLFPEENSLREPAGVANDIPERPEQESGKNNS
jgi:hypothetical protein